MTRWCKDNYLDLHVDKTREMVLDLRKSVCEFIIEGVTVERVNESQFWIINSHMNATPTPLYVKKCHHRMFCMLRLVRD